MDKQLTSFKFFYVVISSLPSNEMCLYTHQSEEQGRQTQNIRNNFNLKMPAQILVKNINITVESTEPGKKYSL